MSKRITPRHTLLAIRADEELDAFIKAIIPVGGVFPHLHRSLSTGKPKDSVNILALPVIRFKFIPHSCNCLPIKPATSAPKLNPIRCTRCTG
uniref:Histone H2A C-terminal domain-containing protein n=1 Tax=Glossina pallidipes TaxID=7398 RepID=A0A1A9ZPA4_GLOPL